MLDFGVSKLLQETSTLTAGLVGSPAYMSPEQARAESNIDARSDLWSLGVVLFQMLAGRRPFASSSPYVVISEVITGPIPSIADAMPGLSPALVHVVQRCLTRDVDARVGSADELIRLLGSSPRRRPRRRDTTRQARTDATLDGSRRRRSGRTSRSGRPATSATGDLAGARSHPMRGPSNTAVALVAGAAA